MYRALLILPALAALHAAPLCPSPREVQPGQTLEELASRYLGDPQYAISIALATNARTADGFKYISNLDDLAGIGRVCVPAKSEAKDLRRSWEAYERAVSEARLPRASTVSKSLVIIPPDQPVDVVAWVRQDQADRLKTGAGGWVNAVPSETWVTVEPHLRDFCRTFVHDRKPEEAKLAQRLEQRLGLSPSSGKTNFVRMRLAQPEANAIFRPCVNPAADHATCSVGPPSSSAADYQQWFLGQYYSSYGQSLIGEFPWTALGYTFDWGQGSAKGRFQRYGESEFVIRKNAPVEVLDVLTTAKYCGLNAP
ncbi:MAG: hypothetical protein JO307_27460 [Bryobacterales bacterium]|nr:hypothetical protein [Bryobacterales bacterium]MBV9397247.1 hypothetical protein [Bryobacterales bacterium]